MLWFWDWHSGNCFQETDVIPQPGSLESEAGIFAMAFDVTGLSYTTPHLLIHPNTNDYSRITIGHMRGRQDRQDVERRYRSDARDASCPI